MKKLLMVLAIVLLCSTKCDDKSGLVSYVFKESYSEVEQDKLNKDIDSLLTIYKIEHLSLDKWMTLTLDKDTGNIEQKMISRYSDTVFTVIYSKFIVSDSVYYELKIRQQIVKTK
jgi:hypothetical protein